MQSSREPCVQFYRPLSIERKAINNRFQCKTSYVRINLLSLQILYVQSGDYLK